MANLWSEDSKYEAKALELAESPHKEVTIVFSRELSEEEAREALKHIEGMVYIEFRKEVEEFNYES